MSDFEFVALAHFDFLKLTSARSNSGEGGGRATDPVDLSFLVRTSPSPNCSLSLSLVANLLSVLTEALHCSTRLVLLRLAR